MSQMGVFKVDITPPLGIDFIGYHRVWMPPEETTADQVIQKVKQLYLTT
jgi:hypothetical protein